MAKLSRTYAPQDLSGQADWFQNWSDVMQTVGASVGFSAGELDRIKDDNNHVQFEAATATTVNNYDDGIRQYRIDILEGDIGSPAPTFPANPTLVPTPVVPPGIWARCNADVTRVKSHPAYNNAMGETLGIVGASPAPISPEDVEPTIELSGAVHDYLFSIVVTGRHDADAWEVWVRPGNVTEWQMIKTATGKSTDVTYSPGGEVPGAVQLEVYVQLRRNNADYGQPSAAKFVTVNP